MLKLERIKYAGNYNDFEGNFIDAKTMEIHQEKHHQTYLDKLTAALEGVDHAFETLEELLANLDKLPEDKQKPVRNNGGGLLNHNIFFQTISPNAGGEPVGELAEEINKTFGDFSKFKEDFSNAAINQFGSGWAWLATDEKGENLHVHGHPNQDNPSMHGHKSILGLDVWEHAYYLHYQNRRADYVAAFWNVVNWKKVNEMYLATRK